MALAGALQVNTMLEELDLGETDLVSACTFSVVEVVLYESLVGRSWGPGRGYSWFQVTEMVEWGKKSKPKKIPGPKVNPQKILCRISEPLKFIIGTTWPGYVGVTMNLQIVLNAQKNPFLNQATRKKKYLPKFCNPKKSWKWNFHSQKHLWSSLWLEICSTPPGGGAAVWNLELF